MYLGLFVSLLATLAFKLCAVGDTGLEAGWVRCGDTMVKMFLLSLGFRVFRICDPRVTKYVRTQKAPKLSVPRGLFGCTYFCEVHSVNVFYAHICTKICTTCAAKVLGAFLWCVLVRLSIVSQCS